jgi:hypothetical protein
MRNKALGYSLMFKKGKQLAITLGNRSALLRVNLMNHYSIIKAKRNTAQVSVLHFQQPQSMFLYKRT